MVHFHILLQLWYFVNGMTIKYGQLSPTIPRHDHQVWSTEYDHPKLVTLTASVCLLHCTLAQCISSYYYDLLSTA